MTTPQQRTRAPHQALVISLVIAVVVVASAITLALSFSSRSAGDRTFVVRGTMTVACSSSYGGCLGYGDLRPGAQVEVLNEKQEILATGVLVASAGSSSYEFVIPGVPRGAKQYGVHIGNSNRGVIWEDEALASTAGFALSIGG